MGAGVGRDGVFTLLVWVDGGLDVSTDVRGGERWMGCTRETLGWGARARGRLCEAPEEGTGVAAGLTTGLGRIWPNVLAVKLMGGYSLRHWLDCEACCSLSSLCVGCLFFVPGIPPFCSGM